MSVESLRGQYPLPRIGQQVRLHSGAVATVVAVYQANTVLKMLTESQAIGLAANARARFGGQWREVYYHADIMFPSGAMDVVDTSKVKEVLDAP